MKQKEMGYDCETTKTREDGMVSVIRTFVAEIQIRTLSQEGGLIAVPKDEQVVRKQLDCVKMAK
jgi:hypothetical protein